MKLWHCLSEHLIVYPTRNGKQTANANITHIYSLEVTDNDSYCRKMSSFKPIPRGPKRGEAISVDIALFLYMFDKSQSTEMTFTSSVKEREINSFIIASKNHA